LPVDPRRLTVDPEPLAPKPGRRMADPDDGGRTGASRLVIESSLHLMRGNGLACRMETSTLCRHVGHRRSLGAEARK
jgi:hypothetical protein